MCYQREMEQNSPRAKAEAQFKSASAEAALFELRMRMLAGKTPQLGNKKIDLKLSEVRIDLVNCYSAQLSASEILLLEKACAIRNKLLHCEFSSARKKLDEIAPKARGGAVSQVDVSGLTGDQMAAKFIALTSGQNVGQVQVSDTPTKFLKDVLGWLVECMSENEFVEADSVFTNATAILDRLSNIS